MKALVLGGTGHLGTALQSHAPQGVAVQQFGRIDYDALNPPALPDCDLIIGSFPLARALQDRPDASAMLARHLDRCRHARLVQLSTDAVFSGRRGMYTEQDAPDPVTAYGKAQTWVDSSIVDHRPDALIVRTSFIFGNSGGRLDKRIRPLVDDPCAVAGQAWASNVFRSPTEVNFLAQGIWRAVDRQLGGVINIAGPRRSIFDFFVEAVGRLGITQCPAPVVDPNGTHDTSLEGGRMRDELGLDQGENWKWFRA